MFQNLRGGMPFYVLHKDEPRLEIGEVVNVGLPIQQFGSVYQNGIMSQPKYAVDVKVSVDGKEMEFKQLPSDLVIADFGSGIVVSESKEAIQSEIDAFSSLSQKALNDIDRHRKVVEECERMKCTLNPHIAKEVEQAKEIETLRNDMSDIKAMLSKILKQSVK